VPLTKVKAKRRELKAGLVERLQDALGTADHAYVFSFAHMRTAKFKDLRAALATDGSRFFLGKNRVMARALAGGASADAGDEFRPGLGALAADLRGNVGMLLTPRTPDAVAAAFAAATEPDYARAGVVADREVVVPKGRLESLPHTMVDELRRLGMTRLRLDKGIPVLPAPHTICAAGDALTSEQCRLLKHFGHQLASFELGLVGHWTAESGAYERLAEPSAGVAGRKAGRGGKAAEGEEDEEDEDDEEDDEEMSDA
jgi:mRNA turnover protein 4